MDATAIIAAAKERFEQAGGPEDDRAFSVLIEEMNAHRANAEVQVQLCSWLNRAANVGRVTSLSAAGAIEGVVATLRAHPAHAGVQKCGLAVLSNMTHDTTICVKLMRVGAVQLAVTAAHAHTDADALVSAMAVIHNVTIHDNARKELAGSVGAVEAVVGAMQMHGSHAGIQEAGCTTLLNLCLDQGVPSNVTKAGKAGAVEALVAALKAFHSNEEIQDCGCLALADLIAGEHLSLRKNATAGGLETVLTLLQQHGSNPRVMGSAARALCVMGFERLLSGTDISHQSVVTAFGAVLAAMQKFPADARLQQFGAPALETILRFAQGHGLAGAAEAADAVSVLVAALKEHTGNVEVEQLCCAALSNMALCNARNTARCDGRYVHYERHKGGSCIVAAAPWRPCGARHQQTRWRHEASDSMLVCAHVHPAGVRCEHAARGARWRAGRGERIAVRFAAQCARASIDAGVRRGSAAPARGCCACTCGATMHALRRHARARRHVRAAGVHHPQAAGRHEPSAVQPLHGGGVLLRGAPARSMAGAQEGVPHDAARHCCWRR
jgi:hypothetical protein